MGRFGSWEKATEGGVCHQKKRVHPQKRGGWITKKRSEEWPAFSRLFFAFADKDVVFLHLPAQGIPVDSQGIGCLLNVVSG